MPVGENIDTETGAITVGAGPNRIDTYVDFLCPACGQFEAAYGSEIQAMIDEGSLTLGFHPIATLDRGSQGSEYSTRSANAAYCLAEVDSSALLPFVERLFQQEPKEGTPGLTDAQLLENASSVGVTGIQDCVNDQTYARFVRAVTERTPVQPGATGIATPTLAVNGRTIPSHEVPQPGKLASLFG